MAWCSPGVPLTLCSWNARGLLGLCPQLRRRKVTYLHGLLSRHVVAMVQEVHGDARAAKAMLHLNSSQWFVHYVPGASTASGGLLFVVARSAFPRDADFQVRVLVPGRVAKLAIRAAGLRMEFVNVHFFGFSAEETRMVRSLLGALRNAAAASPLSVACFVAGDFNFPAVGETRRKLHAPAASPARPALPAGAGSLRTELGLWTEMFQEVDTHFDPGGHSVGRLDRVYAAGPAWLWRSLFVSAAVREPPDQLFYRGLSDHSPVMVSVACSRPRKASNRVAPEVCANPRYQVVLDKLIRMARFAALPALARVAMLKELMHEAARIVRNEMLEDSSSVFGVATLFGAMSRCVALSRGPLAERLRARHREARRHLDVDALGFVSLARPLAFAAEFEQAVDALLGRRLAAVRADGGHVPRKDRKAAAIARQRRMWRMGDRRLVLSGVRASSLAAPARDPVEMTRLLRDHWRPIFESTPASPHAWHEVIAAHGGRLSAPLRVPDRPVLDRICERMRDSAPGLDGLPAAAWRHCPPAGRDALYELFVWSCAGFGLDLASTSGMLAFAPKEGEEETGGRIVCETSSVRTLVLKDVSLKILGGVASHAVRPFVRECTDRDQRGFTPGRDFGENVLLLDTLARGWDLAAPSPRDVLDEPCLLFTDFEAAFPSLRQDFIFDVLLFACFPEGLVCLIFSQYCGATVRSSVGGFDSFFAWVRAGVAQGCPMSSWLFLAAMNVVMGFLRSACSPRMVVVQGCADDLGFALRALRALPALVAAFGVLAGPTGLRLKVVKCVLVPTGVFSDVLVAAMRAAITRLCPDFSWVLIAPCGKYLGYWLGPGAGSRQFVAQLAKMRRRNAALCAAGVHAGAAAREFAARVASVLPYVARLRRVPNEVFRAMMLMAASALHLAPNSLGERELLSMERFGGPRLPDVRTRARGGAFAAGVRFLPSLRRSLGFLEARADVGLPIADVVRGQRSRPHWDEEPIALYLADALWPASRRYARVAAELFPVDFPLGGREAAAGLARRAAASFAALGPGPRWAALWARRAATYGFEEVEMQNLIEVASGGRLRGYAGECLLKSLAGSWFTSKRMHEASILPCLFCGLLLGDDLKHYLRCGALALCFERLAAVTCVAADPAALALAYMLYHHSRFGSMAVSPEECCRGARPLLDAFEGEHRIFARLREPRRPRLRARARHMAAG